MECESWGSLSKQEEAAKRSSLSSIDATPSQSTPLKNSTSSVELKRHSTDDTELDRVLGGGIVSGSLLLLSGEPGIGKSTLTASITAKLAQKKLSILYVSGEESSTQLQARFKRMECNTNGINYLESKPIETLIATIKKEKPDVVVVDSVQTLSSIEMDSAPGTPSLVRYATSLLLEFSKKNNISIILIGQVTKDGSVAGPKTLEHLVDVMISLEGDSNHIYRYLVSKKNRFGATDEIGVFEMTQKGLIPVKNPSAKFLQERTDVAGSVLTATAEGSRIFLVEVQALVEKTFYGTPVRRASGFDQNRLQMLIAILSKRAGLKLGDQDVYLNVIGGMKLQEPAVDLAICAAIISAYKNKTFEHDAVFFGEVGLAGEVRNAPLSEKRINETKRLGLTTAYVPSSIKIKKNDFKLNTIKEIKNLL